MHAAARIGMGWWLAVGFGSALAMGCSKSDESSERLAEGQDRYARYCALCHGANGEGYQADVANALSNQQFLTTASDLLLRTAMARGRPGTAMSGWSTARGGPLSDLEVYEVSRFVRSWQTDPSVDVSSVPVQGVPDRAKPTWDFRCASCHGDRGQGASYMSVSNPEFLAVASDGYLRAAIASGRSSTQMLAFDSLLTAQGIDDLVALIRSWNKPVSTTPYVPPSQDLGDVVINLGGPEPDWDPVERFISVDVVKQAMDAGDELALLDARPPSDYVDLHISGARSVPYYELATFLDQLDPSHWYVTYCGCPHSLSGELYDSLKALGYPKVKVLDEGFFVWQQRGYPVTPGPSPE